MKDMKDMEAAIRQMSNSLQQFLESLDENGSTNCPDRFTITRYLSDEEYDMIEEDPCR